MFNRRDDPATTAGLPSASERLDLQLLAKQLKLDLLSQPPPRITAPAGKAGMRRDQQM
jgi:hypothetical protein